VVRGFRLDEVGPGHFTEVPLVLRFVPEGGNALLAAALEARIDLSRAWGMQVFAETGNVFARVKAIKLGELRRVVGLGIHYRSPFGPLRVDWGFKLDRRILFRDVRENPHQLHLGIGYAF
jgi:outer membrane protein insertion porin family